MAFFGASFRFWAAAPPNHDHILIKRACGLVYPQSMFRDGRVEVWILDSEMMRVGLVAAGVVVETVEDGGDGDEIARGARLGYH